MKLAKSKKIIEEPVSWNEIPYGDYYRQALEQNLKAWWPRLFGFHLLKIGSLSADLDTRDCAISHQVSVGLEGKCLQIIADPYHLPFANKSADVCLLAHTLSYTVDPHRLLQEVDRVLIDEGWLVITAFNPLSMLGLFRIFSIFFRRQSSYRSRMYTQMKLLDWLGMLNFEALYYAHLKVLPWKQQKKKLLNTPRLLAIDCLSVIVARKHVLPISLKPLRRLIVSKRLRQLANATNRSYL